MNSSSSRASGSSISASALLSLAALTALAGCGSSDTTVDPTTGGNSATVPGTGSSGGPVGSDGGTNTGGDGATVDPHNPGPTACPTAKYKTLVIVGDSISDVGGSGGTTGQQPFYRTLLVNNDDALYPDWKGLDLATCWGLTSASVVKASKGGAVATVPKSNSATDKGVLLNQVTDLPATLEGPVLVVGTIGGNDARNGLVAIITAPATFQSKIDGFAQGFGKAMAELTKPNRFGANVKVDVLMSNIYDPSAGTGHFYYAPKSGSCPGTLGLWPDNRETASLLVQWNTAMGNEAAKYPGVRLLDMNGIFEKHNVATPTADNWFFQDCIHPNTAGHNGIRGLFWSGMTKL